MTGVHGCPVARQIEWPQPQRKTCVVGMDSASMARTVSLSLCLLVPSSDRSWRHLGDGHQMLQRNGWKGRGR
jgi:hypothetical protein